ncbi:MAG: TfoX/Sxy family protein [Alphaproteobacteria bacterium]|jgi:DNA transformation protein|nr:TfoX/Sxy family protein [Alphaproteobacteria bacterium]
MASQQSSVDFILEQIADAGTCLAKKMFGGYCIYFDGKVVALVCDDQLFVKPTVAGKAFIGDFEEGYPYPGAKAYLHISGDQWEDADWLSHLIRITAKELPLPVKKVPRTKAHKKKSDKT